MLLPFPGLLLALLQTLFVKNSSTSVNLESMTLPQIIREQKTGRAHLSVFSRPITIVGILRSDILLLAWVDN